jgi:hypothetical protein
MMKEMSDLIDANIKNTNPTVMRSNQIETIVTKVRLVIDELGRNFTNAKNLISELANLLDETQQCEQCQISRKIKEMLKDKINEGKITGKWIEECLPPEYKRKYAKSEPSSLSRNAKKLGKILVDNEGRSLAESSSYEGSNVDNIAHIAHTQTQERDRNQTLQKDTPNNLGISENDDDACCNRGQELEEAFLKALMMIEAEHLSGAEIKFTIPKERYEEVKTAMSNGSNCCDLSLIESPACCYDLNQEKQKIEDRCCRICLLLMIKVY